MRFTPETVPEIYMPEPEAEALRAAYRTARVIGEYGSGGSTAFAATECKARVVSIESDQAWAGDLQAWLDARDVGADRIDLRHCDIGPTGRWGFPGDMTNWQGFWRYPYALWQDPGFNPDLVLIDGRFRIGCLAACMIHCRAPLSVLFDDYTIRPEYHGVADILPPAETIGRLARFELTPGQVTPQHFAAMVPWFFSDR
ncbi:MAG: hypothetical protein Q4G26_08730 [Paracoccus sp. (in: a-proteobacteria)]|nr:hypothetical protein [Paracoccus sp. (in: a-proteobacteria)]